jgi:O-antigen ligase
MATSAVAVQSRLKTGVFVALALLVAAGVGVAAAWDAKLGVAACLALIALPMAIVRPQYVPHVLMVSVFSASLEVGGTVTIGRAVAPLGLLAIAVYVLQQPVKFRHAGLLVGLACAYGLLAFVSLWWSVDAYATVDALITLAVSLGYGATFAILIRTETDLRRLMWVAVCSSVGLAVLWIGAYASGVDRRFNEAGDPNFFAALQVATLPLVLVLASQSKNQMQKLFLAGAIVVIAGSIISTLSVGGVVTMGVAGLVIFLLPANNMFRSRSQKGAYLLAALIGLGLLFGVAREDFNRRLDIKFGSQDVGDGRQDLWNAALNGYDQRPWTGLGYGGFYASSFQLLRTTPGVDIEAHLRFVGVGEYVHNAYIGSLAELGPLGLVVFVGMIVVAIRTLRKAARRAELSGEQFKRKAANALLVGVVAFAVSSFLLSTETSRMLWMLLGLTVAIAKMTDAPEAAS